MTTFIRAAEVWVPSEDGQLLVHGGGLYPDAPAFGALSHRMCFGRAEGLPGRAWDDQKPVLISPLQGTGFLRADAARAAGMDAALAWPVFAGERLTSVAVLLCRAGSDVTGALELWHNDPRVTGDLTLEAGHFRTSDEQLPSLTREAWLPPGQGAPGLAWQQDHAVFMDRLDGDTRFLRAQAAFASGIVHALALPCHVPSRHHWVLSLLSSRQTPVVRRVESWLMAPDSQHLQRAFGFCTVMGRLPAQAPTQQPLSALGAIGQAWQSATAVVAPASQVRGALTAEDALTARLQGVLALPLMDEAGTTEVLALYL